MPIVKDSVRAAVVQASPIFFDRKGSIEKTVQLTADAVAKGAELIVFPEAIYELFFSIALPQGVTAF